MGCHKRGASGIRGKAQDAWLGAGRQNDRQSRFAVRWTKTGADAAYGVIKKPKLLLLDEHTAALDPVTATKVLELSDRIIQENNLTALMITHNMTDAIKHGNRLIMMDEGRIILDISREEKTKLTKADLMQRFADVAGYALENDQTLLSK